MQRLRDHRLVRLRYVAEEPGRDDRAGCQAEAHRQLLERRCDGAGHARILLLDVGIRQRVHARELQRIEEALQQADAGDGIPRRARAHEGKQADREADADRVDDQDLAVAEARQHLRRDQLHAHRGGGRRHHQQTRLPRRQFQAQLVQQRQEERQAADPETRDEAAQHGHAERAHLEQRQAQQRELVLRRVPGVGTQQGDRQRQHQAGLRRVERVLAEDFQQP